MEEPRPPVIVFRAEEAVPLRGNCHGTGHQERLTGPILTHNFTVVGVEANKNNCRVSSADLGTYYK